MSDDSSRALLKQPRGSSPDSASSICELIVADKKGIWRNAAVRSACGMSEPRYLCLFNNSHRYPLANIIPPLYTDVAQPHKEEAEQSYLGHLAT